MSRRLALSCGALAFSSALSIFGLWFASHSWGHDVGEPDLERTRVWRKCCGGGDCVPKPVEIINRGGQGNNLAVRIDGIEAVVEKKKFSPVPTKRTWVCFVDSNGTVSNDNIRCILYPENRGVT